MDGGRPINDNYNEEKILAELEEEQSKLKRKAQKNAYKYRVAGKNDPFWQNINDSIKIEHGNTAWKSRKK